MLTRMLIATVALLTTAGPILAQQAPTEVDKAPEKAQWIGMVVAIVLVVAVLVASFISSKRGHQD
jgi:hypothetical protein